jgi:hypothetical protein
VRPSVRAAFYETNAPWEGVCSWLYLDIVGLVTVGVGNLVDPLPFATTLPFIREDGSPATREEIREAWLAVKARKDLAVKGGGAFRSLTSLRLSADGIRELVDKKLRANVQILRARFEKWDEMPADAQLAVLCLAWAVGPSFRWPMYETAIRRADYAMAAVETSISEKGNPGVKPRNEGMRVMLRNAAHVMARGLDRDVLFYPGTLSTPSAPTLPQFPTK